MGYYNLCRAFGGNIASYRATGYEASLVQLFSWHVGRARKTLICHREIGWISSFVSRKAIASLLSLVFWHIEIIPLEEAWTLNAAFHLDIELLG